MSIYRNSPGVKDAAATELTVTGTLVDVMLLSDLLADVPEQIAV
jgi:hypothetical protein